MAEPEQIAKARQRLEKDRDAWMVTTRPDGRPHTAPIWFVWHGDNVYVMTGGVKLANVQHNGFAAINGESGRDVVIVEGTAKVIPVEGSVFSAVKDEFKRKYDWDVTTQLDKWQLIEIAPVKILAWNA